ncbi:MAG: hypothetical protein CTY19_11320 [Methylomonas sp.]|nr:MAG: hypothetical protein CTY19_11320 [Methylomonas sp.]
MIHKNLLNPEILSRLIFDEREKGVFYVQGVPHYDFKRARPEEIIRQLCALSLIHHYHYPEQNIILEYPIQMGSTKKRADIVILDDLSNPYIVIEVKKQEIDENTRAQLESYLAITKAPFGCAVSKNDSFCISNNGMFQSDIPLFKGMSTDSPTPLQRDEQPSRTSLQVESFERQSLTSAKITIKGHTLKFSNRNMAEFSNLRARFLEAGVAIPNIRQKEWDTMFVHLMENNRPSSPPVFDNPPPNRIELLVSELLESSTDPLYGPDVVAFTPLFNTLVNQSNGVIKTDEKHILTAALLALGFFKLGRIRLPGFEIDGDNRFALWSKYPVNGNKNASFVWAKSIIDSRLASLSDKETELPGKTELSQTAISLIEYCSTEGRICPNSESWQNLWQMLLEYADKFQTEQKAPEPLTIPIIYKSWEKRNALKNQIVWADACGLIAKVDQFLRRLSQDQWQ